MGRNFVVLIAAAQRFTGGEVPREDLTSP